MNEFCSKQNEYLTIEPLQFSKGVNLYGSYFKNAKPRFEYLGFVEFKPKVGGRLDQTRADFWLKQSISAP